MDKESPFFCQLLATVSEILNGKKHFFLYLKNIPDGESLNLTKAFILLYFVIKGEKIRPETRTYYIHIPYLNKTYEYANTYRAGGGERDSPGVPPPRGIFAKTMNCKSGHK